MRLSKFTKTIGTMSGSVLRFRARLKAPVLKAPGDSSEVYEVPYGQMMRFFLFFKNSLAAA